jgi:hypothetical protein
VFIMEQLDRFVENLFDGEVASLPIPPKVITQATDLVNDMRNDPVEINDLTAQLKELDNSMKDTKSKFVIKQLEESYADINKALTILQHRRLGFHSDLDQIIRKICLDHQAQVTGYNDLVKGHIDLSKQKKMKKIAKKNVPPPPPPVAERQIEKSPERVIPSPSLEPAADENLPRPTESVPVASLVHEENPPQQNVSEEGEIPQSERQVSPAHDVPNNPVPPSALQTAPEEQHP